MGHNIFLGATAYPKKEETLKLVGIDIEDSIRGFVEAIPRRQILPFLGIYQRMAYSYFLYTKLMKTRKLDFMMVTGGSSVVPQSMASRTIVYVHYPVDLEIIQERYLRSGKLKGLYIKPWRFMTKNLDFIRNCTLITNSNYTREEIKKTWGLDSSVIYPPCPQYSFPLESSRKDSVCTIGRFSPEKNYEFILKIARIKSSLHFDLIGNITDDKKHYFRKLQKIAPQNVTFHVNASVSEKSKILSRSKAMLHSFVGEHFGIGLIEAMGAGLYPVAHNSGAAKIDNLIPKAFLYNNLDEASAAVEKAVSDWKPTEAKRLREFARSFSPELFSFRMKEFILKWIASNLNKKKVDRKE